MAGSSRNTAGLYFLLIFIGLALGVVGAMGWGRWQTAFTHQRSATTANTGTTPSAQTKPHTPAPGVHPIIDASIEYLLGGSEDGTWKKAAELAPKLSGDEVYRLYTLTDYLGKVTGSRAAKDATSDESLTIAPPLGTEKENIIGVCGDWNPQPRLPRIDTKTADYQQAVKTVLKENDLANAPVNITQVIHIDLRGDGQEETLITATTPRKDYLSSTSGKTGDYSMVLLQWTAGGATHTTAVTGQFFNGSRPDDMPLAYTVAGLLDLNGDGAQEIIVDARYNEGGGKYVFTFDGTGVQGVFANGWGS